MISATNGSEWKLVPLGSIAKFRNGINYNKSNFGTGMKVVNVKNFQDRIIIPVEDLDEINPEGVVSKESLLKNGDIIFVRSNGNCQLIGRSLFVNELQEKITHSAFTIRVRFTSDHAIPRFYSYLFRSSLMRQIFSSQGGGTNINNLNQRILENLQVPLPPLPTQRKIAAILSAYDDLIENNTRRIKILEEMAQALYREWFVHFRFPGHEKVRMVDSPLGKIPEGWAIAKFTDIADVFSGGTPRTTIPVFWNGNIPFFTPTDATSPSSFYVLQTGKNITEKGLEKCNSYLYPKNTVFITARGTVGKIVMPAMSMAMNQSCYALKGKNGFTQYYIFLSITSCIEQLRQSATGAVFDTIIIDTFRNLEVIKPSKQSVEAFTALVDPIFDQILITSFRNRNLRHTRDLLLPKLISGELNKEVLGIKTEAKEDDRSTS